MKFIQNFFSKIRPKHEAEPWGAHRSETIRAAHKHIDVTMSAFETISKFEKLLEAPFVEPMQDVHCSIIFDILLQHRVQIVYVIGETEPMCARVVEDNQ